MKTWKIVRACLLAFAIGFLSFGGAASAQDATADPAYDYEGIALQNPSATVVEDATPAATPESGIDGPHGALLGDPEAPVLLQIYSDFQCPHCRTFHTDIEPLLVEEFVNTGQIRIEFVEFPIIGMSSVEDMTDDTKESVQAAEAVYCAAAQDAYMPYREALMAGTFQPNSGALSDEVLVGLAGDLDLDARAFETCIAEGTYEDDLAERWEMGLDAGVSGTPTMMIDGEILQPESWDDLAQMIEDAIAAAE